MAAIRPTLYYALFSPPSRACLMTVKLIGLNVNLKTIDFNAKENHTDWFLKINPLHTVPVFSDEGFNLSDSHSIVTYMVSKYGKSQHDNLYPKDLVKRAVVNERLFFDNGVLFRALKEFANKVLYGDETRYDEKCIEFCHTAYAFLEQFLARSTYTAGEQLSVADVSISTTLATLETFVPITKERYPKTHDWVQRMRNELPEYEAINDLGAQQLLQRFEDAREKNKAKN